MDTLQHFLLAPATCKNTLKTTEIKSADAAGVSVPEPTMVEKLAKEPLNEKIPSFDVSPFQKKVFQKNVKIA